MTLIDAAARVRENAYVPYSRFKVGAAVRGGSGAVHVGCNVENVAYPLGNCAESGAISALVAAGETEWTEIAIIADCQEPLPPCGGCRQRMAEFAAPEAVVIMATTNGAELRVPMADLLPGAFNAAHMSKV